MGEGAKELAVAAEPPAAARRRQRTFTDPHADLLAQREGAIVIRASIGIDDTCARVVLVRGGEWGAGGHLLVCLDNTQAFH